MLAPTPELAQTDVLRTTAKRVPEDATRVQRITRATNVTKAMATITHISPAVGGQTLRRAISHESIIGQRDLPPFAVSAMSPLLDSLLAEVGDPSREDLLSVAVPHLRTRIGQLSKRQQLELRDEVTEIRRTLPRDTPAWLPHQIIFQYLWHLNHVDEELSEEQRALRTKIDEDYRQRNGDWYAAATWLTPEEVGQRMKQRTAELLRAGPGDASRGGVASRLGAGLDPAQASREQGGAG
jgi:hypothetical protein